ncbi:MAG: hypothetical protein ACK5JI_02830, partial [Azonexus sp.]
GKNTYTLCIADSDTGNPIAQRLAEDSLVKYSINPGTGLDDNLFYFWKNNYDDHDYIFGIPDDAVFVPGVNPLDMIDGAAASGEDIAIFNSWHSLFRRDGSIEVPGSKAFPDLLGVADRTMLSHHFMTRPIDYGFALYSTRALKNKETEIRRFNGKLMYLAPILFAAMKRKLIFIPYPICFSNNLPVRTRSTLAGGAWESHAVVFNGLVNFLAEAKGILPSHFYAELERFLLVSLFDKDGHDRKRLDPRAITKTQEEVRTLLSSLPSPALTDWEEEAPPAETFRITTTMDIKLEKIIKRRSRTIIYPAGGRVVELLATTRLSFVNILALSDKNRRKQAGGLMGYRVIPPDSILNHQPDVVLVIVSAKYQKEILAELAYLKTHGIRVIAI